MAAAKSTGKLAKYTMKSSGSTTGRVSGKVVRWRKGETLDLPDGELDHLGGGDFDKKPVAAKAAAAKNSGGDSDDKGDGNAKSGG